MEYKADHPDGFQYSQFCFHYRSWRQSVDPCLRQDYKAGEKLFVDYCGLTMPVVDQATGEIRQAQIFVAVWGASNCAIRVHVGDHEYQTVPEPRPMGKSLLQALGLTLPDVVPSRGIDVATRKKLPPRQ